MSTDVTESSAPTPTAISQPTTPKPTTKSLNIFPAGDISVTNVVTKKDVPIHNFYTNTNRPTVLVFLRRWGCALCRGYAKDLNTNLIPLLNANNVGIEAVGVEWFGIEDFRALKIFPDEKLYIDDGKKAYKKLGLEYLGTIRGLAHVFTESARKYRNYVKEKLGMTGNLKGDGFQLGATYVLGSNGEIWFEHRQKDYGDHPDLKDIVGALKNHMSDFDETPPGVEPMKPSEPAVCS